VTFTDLSGGIITNRLWNFGDGTTTNLAGITVSHLYNVPGTNSVTLTVNGPQGSSTLTKTNYISVRGSIRITSLKLTSTNATVSFETAAGRFYRLEYAASVGTGAWATAVDNLSGTGGIVDAIDATTPAIRRFYRVKQLP
jgi:PKD repeat protein